MKSETGSGTRGIDLAGMKSVEELAREFEDVVVERLQRLERSNRLLRAWIVVLVLLVACLMGGAAFTTYLMLTGSPAVASRRVTAREFVLADARGRPRGTWGIGADGSARVVLNDAAGQPRLRFSVIGAEGSPGMTLLDEKGTPRVVLGTLADGTTSFVFADAAGHSRAVLGVAGDAASLVFADRFGATRASVGVDAAGKPDVTVFDEGAAPQEPAPADSAVPDTTQARKAPAGK